MSTLKDTHRRSITKSITWRISAIITLVTISWLITHNWKQVTLITLIFHTIQIALYYFHERIWERVNWGRVRHPLSELPLRNSLNAEDIKIIRSKLEQLGYIE